MDDVVIERGCFLGLATAAIEAYDRETNGFLVGNEGVRRVRRRRRTVTVVRAAYPIQTADRKRNWVTHGNVRAFQRARRAMENLDIGYEVLGGFHSHTGDDGDASLSRTDLDYVADELRRRRRAEQDGEARWLEVVVALKRREWSRRHEVGWSSRPYRRKVGCTVALEPNHGYDLVFGGYWIEADSGGEEERLAAREARLLLPWSE